jgi:hypothetical protein
MLSNFNADGNIDCLTVICSRHDIAEQLLRLALSTSQAINITISIKI